MSKKLKKAKEIKSTMDEIDPAMDLILRKMHKLKQETNNTKQEFKTLDQNLKKILGSFAKNMIGSFAKKDNFSKNNDFGLSSIVPKILSSLISGTRASGGPVLSNNAYLVGEKGPEIFMPNNAGRIIPNNNIGKSPINIVMNIATPNADSFQKNQNQILADAISMMSRVGKNL